MGGVCQGWIAVSARLGFHSRSWLVRFGSKEANNQRLVFQACLAAALYLWFEQGLLGLWCRRPLQCLDIQDGSSPRHRHPQTCQNPLIQEYTLIHIRDPTMKLRYIPYLRDFGRSGSVVSFSSGSSASQACKYFCNADLFLRSKQVSSSWLTSEPLLKVKLLASLL